MKDLSYMYSTHSFHRTTVDGKKIDICSTTIVTPRGTFKENEWIQLIEKQARDRFETNILNKLLEYSLKELAWINTEKEACEYALNLYSSRIWENKEWLGYDEFNMKPNENNNAEQISLF